MSASAELLVKYHCYIAR